MNSITEEAEPDLEIDFGPYLIEDEVRDLIHACLSVHPSSEAELVRVVKWAEQVRIDSAMLEMVLDGRTAVTSPQPGKILYQLRPDRKLAV
jgi:hypothetical protein